MAKAISVILLSWNRKDDILKTITDLAHQTYTDFEVVIVDQASSDGTAEYLREHFEGKGGFKLVFLHKNLGVPTGRNIGIANAGGNLLVFLDNDASLKEDALELVIKEFKKDKELGIIGFRIVNSKTNELDINSWVYQKCKIKEELQTFETYTFCGCGHAIRKVVFEEAGFYWDDLFFSWEEMDLSLRVLNKGYKIIYEPSIIAYHRAAEENRVFNRDHECLRLRNSLWVSWRYLSLGYGLRETILRLGAYLIKGLRQHCFLKMGITSVASFSMFHLLFSKENKISKVALEKYGKLSNKGCWVDQLKQLITN